MSITYTNCEKFVTSPRYPKGNPPTCYGESPTATITGIDSQTIPVSGVSMDIIEKALPFYWLLKSIDFEFSFMGTTPFGDSYTGNSSGTATKGIPTIVNPKEIICLSNGKIEFSGNFFNGFFEDSILDTAIQPFLYGETVVFVIGMQGIFFSSGPTTDFNFYITNFPTPLILDPPSVLVDYDVFSRSYVLPFGIGGTEFYLQLLAYDYNWDVSITDFEITNFNFFNPVL